MNSYELSLAATAAAANETDRTYSDKELQDAVANALVLQATTNETQGSLRSRMAAMAAGGYDFADTNHNVWIDYGYPALVAFSMYWNMYRRFGIAKAVVERIPEKMWITPPIVKGLGKDFETIVERLNLWQRLLGVDRRQRIGQYGGLFMRVKDGKPPSEPLDTIGGEKALVEIKPLNEAQLIPVKIDQDIESERFGQPITYQYSASAIGERNRDAQTSIIIHHTRIVIISEGADDGGIYGVSSLEAPFNSLMDLRKVMGGGGEGFYKNAAQSLIFQIKDIAAAGKAGDQLKAFNAQVTDFMRNQPRRQLMAPGMEVKALDSSLISPKEFVAASMADVAASVPMPVTILIGQQTGRLASDEDVKAFCSTVQSRRGSFGTESIRKVIDWFIEHGAIKNATYTVEWDDLLAASDEDRMKTVKSMTTANKDNVQAGGDRIFSTQEIRKEAGPDFETTLAPLPTPDETLDDDDGA